MAIMQSCCCWQSVRKGSFACAIYSGIYFALLAATTGAVLEAESEYLAGNRSLPQSPSILEPDNVSPTTIRFNAVLFFCSCCGVVCSFLLLYGLFRDKRHFLIPWMLTVVAIIALDVSHAMYILSSAPPALDPSVVMLHTLNFFLLCLNIYSLLCIISQYQEYAAGRGTAADDCEYRVPAVRYAVQPTTTATSCLSSRRTVTSNETKATVTATPTQSPTYGQNLLSVESAVRPLRKHVQFPDTPTNNDGVKSETSGLDCSPIWNGDTETTKMSSFHSTDALTVITVSPPHQSEKSNVNEDALTHGVTLPKSG